MIRISALNEESEEESGSEEEVTREASEQIAFQQYTKALELQRKGNLKDATQLLRDLLDTELLHEVQKPAPGEKVPGPLFNLKYLSYKNLATMLSVSEEVDAAIEAYCAASELDDTDVTLWHRLGQLCMRAKRYEMALRAFQHGAECNPRHWPCLDKIITLLLGLDYKEECISTIYEALQLDPGYLRGLAYRKHIYTVYPYIKDFMEYLNPIYKWDEKEDDPFDDEKALKLLKEAEDIHEIYLEQQKAEQFKYVLPDLKLVKPVTNLNWKSVGDSLVHMHHYMAEYYYSHACKLEMVYQKVDKDETMEVCEEPKESEPEENKIEEAVTDTEKNPENVSENENNDLSDKDKAATDTEKVDAAESDVEMAPEAPETPTDSKIPKKTPVRRRGSALSFLRMWEWCKRKSGRKKTTGKQDQDNNIYETLRKMVPIYLVPEMVEKKENQARETSPDITNLDKLFEEKEKPEEVKEYFGSEDEQKDVKNFINKYTENKRDIIDILKDYLIILAGKWREKWPEGLPDVFVDANKCYLTHIDIPSCTSDNDEDLLHYTNVNLLVEEFTVNEKFNANVPDDKQQHDLSVIETIGIILNLRPQIFDTTECLDLNLRYLWVRLHIQLLNKCNEFALDCLHQLLFEFEAMGEHHDTYNLNIVNFTFKPIVNETEVFAGIKFLERNKRLATVMDLYERGNYDEVLSIVIDTFDHCKTMARNEEDVALDFAVHLAVILDTYWALDKPDECFKWSLTCLHEALKHYFRFTTGSPEYDKWTLTVVKILCCMEHILTTEGLTCLDTVTPKELSQGLEDLIRVIGHQVETNASEMPFGTVIPWIIMHYILQREEDQGRARIDTEKDEGDDVPNPIMVLFIAHEQLGKRGWCCKSEGRLLYFTLDTVVPRLRSPSLAKSLEQVVQYMEQCVYCLFGHPGRKNKIKYLVDHNVPAATLDWKRAQQLYEIFRPPTLPALEGKLPGITADSEQLFHKILALLPPECDPQKYLPDIDKFIKGLEDKLPNTTSLLPYKMRDIYFLLGDYYYKKEEVKLGVKFNKLDVAVNNDRVESWARISLAKAVNLDRMLNSCKNLNHEREYLNPAKAVIRCFKRTVELDPTLCHMWTEYGMFAYSVHSFCSRVLKQASESLSMEDFESLEKQKEDMLDTTQKSFVTVLNELSDNKEAQTSHEEETWLHFYMLGKVGEKRNKPPSVYLDYYMKAVKSLQESDATYPLKINYTTPPHLSIEVLEMHYRIHASILKYIEQHENKPIPTSVGKVFSTCIDEWKKGPFTKKTKKDGGAELETNTEPKPAEPIHPANILKRSISDAGEEESYEAKRLKMEAAAAKVRRSASYDTERTPKEPIVPSTDVAQTKPTAAVEENKQEVIVLDEKSPPPAVPPAPAPAEPIKEITPEGEKSDEKKDATDGEKKGESSSSTSSTSSSDSSSSESSSDSSSSSSSDSENSSKSANDAKPLTDDEIMKIVSACLDALEDCASRFSPHYKAIYRLAHYHFYYKKGKDIERCRDLMLSNFTSRLGQKLGGLFSERKPSNFFNNIWKIPPQEIDRPGGFIFHMNRSVLLTLEILKEIDDHKTLLDLSLHLNRTPDPDKKYLRDSDREELAQQAFSLCIQSLKGQLTKFSQQADLKSNEVERQALNSLMLDIYRAYQRAQKQPNSKQFTNLLIEGYKLATSETIAENANLVDISMKYCQKLIQKLKHEATMASLDKSQNAQKKQAAKAAVAETVKATTSTAAAPSRPEQKAPPTSTSAASAIGTGLPKLSAHDMAAAFQNYLPMLNDPVLSQQAAAALSLSTYLSNMSLAGYPSLQHNLQSTLQSSLQNSFQAEFYRQFLGQSFSSFMPPVKKQKRGPKQGSVRQPSNPQLKTSKSFTAPSMPAVSKAAPTPVISTLQKSASTPLTPSMGTVLQNLPASMSANLSSFGATHSTSHASHTMPAQAHMSTASTVNAAIHTKPPMPHQQVSPGKTLQEKLAERQKHHPISKSHDINASISKLPSSLTITKTSVPKPVMKKPDAKKQLPFTERPKPITSDEVIVLDDD
nr:calcineurin-binding protein cabin-1 [Helicoverpa armigera]